MLTKLTVSAPEGVPARFIEKFPAIFVTTAKLAKEALNLNFDESAVTKFCYQCYQKHQANVGAVDESYADIIGECSVNLGNFYDSESEVAPRISWGSIR